jgi:hypothetical protein
MLKGNAWLIALAIITAAVATGCSKRDQATARAPEASNAPATTPEAGSGHAAGIVPGSYEDWCDEHQVQETMCTRCDASLIPAFKAAGDWDEKHGLPKSQCLKCDPTLKIVRPPKA